MTGIQATRILSCVSHSSGDSRPRGELGVHPEHAVSVSRRLVKVADPGDQPGVTDRPRRRPTSQGRVVAGLGHPSTRVAIRTGRSEPASPRSPRRSFWGRHPPPWPRDAAVDRQLGLRLGDTGPGDATCGSTAHRSRAHAPHRRPAVRDTRGMASQLAVDALRDAIALHDPGATAIVHSDRGSQLCSHAYQRALREAHLPALDLAARPVPGCARLPDGVARDLLGHSLTPGPAHGALAGQSAERGPNAACSCLVDHGLVQESADSTFMRSHGSHPVRPVSTSQRCGYSDRPAVPQSSTTRTAPPSESQIVMRRAASRAMLVYFGWGPGP